METEKLKEIAADQIVKAYVTHCEQITEKELYDLNHYFHYKNMELIKKNLCDEYISSFLYAVGECENNEIWGATDEELLHWVKLI